VRRVAVTVEQLARPAPGGIATYARGLLSGLADLADPQLEVVALGPASLAGAGLRAPLHAVRAPVALVTRAWSRWPLGVPGDAEVVHATTLAGPYRGGARGAVHSVAVHDLLWRDEPAASTRAGRRFHESRLARLRGAEAVRVVTTSPALRDRLVAEGIDATRIFPARLGVDDATDPAGGADVAALLSSHGVAGPYTLAAGTREPRKNLAALAAAQRAARAQHPGLGPLVLVGPPGWGGAAPAGAVELGAVARERLLGLYRDAAVVAYVPLAEGWGLPPVEALAQGAATVASTATPSVAGNPEAVRVDARDVDAIAAGLVAALESPGDDAARERRRASVAHLTWRECARDHLAAWA
jgi:hypothetical protein